MEAYDCVVALVQISRDSLAAPKTTTNIGHANKIDGTCWKPYLSQLTQLPPTPPGHSGPVNPGGSWVRDLTLN